MRALFKSDFIRFVGGFTLGAVALVGLQPAAQATVIAWVGTAAHFG